MTWRVSLLCLTSGWLNDLKMNMLLKSKPAPPQVNSVPTSPWVSTSTPVMPAHTQTVLREASSSSPMQTTETQETHDQLTVVQQMEMVSWHSLRKVFVSALKLTHAWNKIHG